MACAPPESPTSPESHAVQRGFQSGGGSGSCGPNQPENGVRNTGGHAGGRRQNGGFGERPQQVRAGEGATRNGEQRGGIHGSDRRGRGCSHDHCVPLPDSRACVLQRAALGLCSVQELDGHTKDYLPCLAGRHLQWLGNRKPTDNPPARRSTHFSSSTSASSTRMSAKYSPTRWPL